MVINPGTVIAERYEIVEKIGSGGMAIVYRAKDKKLGRFVTFKVMREEYVQDEEFITRFNIEATAAASLSNPNIVNVYDVGQEGLIHYIVMEYLDGVTLKELIHERAPFDDEEVLGVAIQIANGLEHAHKHGVIHRDIKPQNILVTNNGIVKVTDFGIARAAASIATAATMVNDSAMGSVHYFSPEQARGGFVDSKSDLYSLGIVMYEMAAGRLPFDGDTAVSVALKQMNDPLPDLRAINPNVSDRLVKIILKATEKQSMKRYATAEEISIDLKRALTNPDTDDLSNDISSTVRLTREEIAAIQDVKNRGREQSGDYEWEEDVQDSGYDDEYGDDDVYEDQEYTDYEYDDDDDDSYHEQEKNYKKVPRKSASNNYDKKTERNIVIAAILTALTIVIFLSSLAYTFLRDRSGSASSRPLNMPDLRGKTLEEASETAKALDINIRVAEDYDDEVDKGQIISQNFDGEGLYPGDTIDVVISLGTDKFEVPLLEKKDLNEVYSIMQDLPFKLDEKDFEYNDDLPIYVVIRQEPPAGTMRPAGETVKIYISQGPEPKTVTVPSVYNMTEAEAIEILQNARLRVHSSSSESTRVEKGRVMQQSEAAGKSVNAQTLVTIMISTGPPEPAVTPTPTPVRKTKSLTIDPYIELGTEQVHLKVIKITGASGTSTVVDKDVRASEFPMTIQVNADEDAEYHVYLVDGYGAELWQGSQTVHSSEES